jgi:alkylhydroperoxidase family enzyme
VDADQVQAVREFNAAQGGLNPLDAALFDFAMWANADSHAIAGADVAALLEKGATEAQIVELLEVANLGNGFNLSCNTLGIEADDFLTGD